MMRVRSLFLLSSILFITLNGYGQNYSGALSQSYVFTATGSTTGFQIIGRDLGFAKIKWATNAVTVPSTCTLNLQISPDNVNWTTVSTKTCTKDGQSGITPISTSFIRVNLSAYTATAVPSTLNVYLTAFTDADTETDINNFFLATANTNINSIGTQLSEKGGRWSVVSAPASGSQASASIAAEANVRHVADCVSFSGSATAAPTATALTVSLRDGATGAGTVIWSMGVVATATTGNLILPFGMCGLNVTGTTNTAMTLEFSAGLTSLIETVTITGFNVN